MADPMWPTKIQKVPWFEWNSLLNPLKHAFFRGFNGLKIWYSGVFGVADYKSELETYKYKMTDPIWWTKMEKVTPPWTWPTDFNFLKFFFDKSFVGRLSVFVGLIKTFVG